MSWTHTRQEIRSTPDGTEYDVVFTHSPSGTVKQSQHFFVTGHEPQAALDLRASLMDDRAMHSELGSCTRCLVRGDDPAAVPLVFSTQPERDQFIARNLVNISQDDPDVALMYMDFMSGFTDLEFVALLVGATVSDVAQLRQAVTSMSNARRDFAHSIPQQGGV